MEKKKYLFKASHKTSIFITDYIDYQEYFDFSKFNEYINNLYIEIELEGEIKAEELIFTRIYSNKNVLFNSDRGFTPYEDGVSAVGNKDYKSKIEMLNQIYNGKSKSIKYEDVNYDVFCFEDSIIVEYELKNDKVHINYSIFKHDFIYKMINEKLIYNENVTNTDNLEVLNDYNLIKNIIDYLIELD